MAERRLRVVHALDTTSMLGGGVSEAVRGLCLALADQGSDVQVVAGRDARSDADAGRWDGLPVTLVGAANAADLLTGGSFARAIRAHQPDVVHLHGIWGPAARGVVRLVREVPVVLSPHGMFDAWAMRRSRAKKRVSALLWEHRLARGARLFHALCDAEARSIAALYPGGKIAIVPNGVALPAPAASQGAPPDRKILLFLGRLHPKKGVAELLDAWAELPPAVRSRWRLVVGGWDELGMLPQLEQQVASLGLAGDVQFPGGVQGEDKDRLFRSASAFVLASYSEGLPMAVLEAWSYRLPVFMTDACNLPDGFEAGAAFRVTPNAQDLAATLASTLDDAEALGAAGSAGRALVERDYGWQAVAAAMANAYAAIQSRAS